MEAKSGEKKKFFNELEIGVKDEAQRARQEGKYEILEQDVGGHNEGTERDGEKEETLERDRGIME